MGTRSPSALIEHLAGLVLSVDADATGVLELERGLGELVEALQGAPSAQLDVATQTRQRLQAVQGSPADAIKLVSDAVVALQRQPAAPAPVKRVVRDDETLELVRDFLEESGDALANADEMLLAIESSAATPDQVNALFRVFHTIKGVAGFLELSEIVSLSHATESVMNEVRDGRCKLAGESLELVFKATALLRGMLDALKKACEAGVELASEPEAGVHIARLKAFLAKMPREEDAGPPITAPGKPPPMPAAAPPPVVATAPVRPAPVAEPAPPPAGFQALPLAPQPPEPAEGPAPAAGATKLRETVKVDLERVDNMVEMIGELIIVESMLKHSRELSTQSLTLRNALGQLGKISRDLQNAAMRMRTVPVHGVFQKMARLTREVGRKAGKDVVLVTTGEGTEMDRAMVERLEDPLVHMVRNACDHGIETPEARTAAGKPATGVLTLSASHKGGSIIIELSDDGAGLDRERILTKAVEKGLVQNPAGMSDAEVFQLIFAPGFSTAAKVTDISGRGVGMDVVKRNIEGMRGRVLIESTKGKGTTFRLVLPLTLAIIDGMLIKVGRERYLVPSLSIVEALQPTREMLSSMGERDELLSVRGQVIPILRLSQQLVIEGARQDPTTALIVVVESVGKRVGLLVDEVIAQQQVVIKALGQGVGRAEFYSGAAILSDGCIGLILNVDKLCGLITYRHRVASGDAHREEQR
ncbi:MAG: chemotaxis protein CheA [Archangium sp.]|nr:chemotaxis protein CheA [Archangium sp.]